MSTALEEQLLQHAKRLEELQDLLMQAYKDAEYHEAEHLEAEIDEIQSDMSIMSAELRAGKYLD